jgi:ketosteroid isomerase-like protein
MKTLLLSILPSALLAITVAMPLAASAQGASTAEQDRNRALVQRGFDAWRDGTGSPYELLADDVNWTITGNSLAAKSFPSREAFLSEVIRPFNARMRDRLIPTIHRLYTDGDTVIALFDAKGTARDGKPYSNSYAWFLQMKDGRIVKAHAFFDSIAFDEFWRRVRP